MSGKKEDVRFYLRPQGAQSKAIEDAIVEWINEVRAARGLPALQEANEPMPREEEVKRG